MRIALRVPTTNERSPLYMEQALAAMHQGNPSRLPLTLAYGRVNGHVTLWCRPPAELRSAVEAQLYAHYPECHIEELSESAAVRRPDDCCWEASLRLSLPLFPIKRFGQFEDALAHVTADPLTAILTALRPEHGSAVVPSIEIDIAPARTNVRTRYERCLARLTSPFFRSHPTLATLYTEAALSSHPVRRVLGWALARFAIRRKALAPGPALDTSTSRPHEREADLQAASDKVGRLLFEARICLRVWGPESVRAEAWQKLREMAGVFGQFTSPRTASFQRGRIHRSRRRRWTRPPSFVLSAEELATLWHPATSTVRTPAMATAGSREMEPPVQLPTPASHPGIAVLGEATFRSQRTLCGILPDDRRRHVLIQGKTGMGKTTLLSHLIRSDIAAGKGVGLLDPHGDLCEGLLASIPKHRTNDVALLDAGDATHPLSFNALSCRSPSERPLITSGIVAAFKKLYGEFWGPRMEHILRNAVLAILEVPGSSLLTLLRLLNDVRFRDGVTARVTDPVVRAFWEREFPGLPPKLQAEALAPLQNKLGHFISSPLLRHIVAQSRSRLDLRSILDDGKILLVNLSKGRTGDDASSFLGSFLVTGLQLAAMSRADVAEDQRTDWFLCVDEFQNYATDAFATILSEARKYRLNLTVANQYLAQIEEGTLAAVFGNVGTIVTFAVGAQDAEALAEQLGGELTPQDLLALPKHQAYVRLLIDGMPSRPFSLRTVAPEATHDPERADIVRRTSRQRDARPASLVEREIAHAFLAA